MATNGETLAAANGGIAPPPDLPQVELNLPDITPSLVYLKRRDGRLLKEVRLPAELRQLSIRHLAVGRDDTVATACRWSRPTVGTAHGPCSMGGRGAAVHGVLLRQHGVRCGRSDARRLGAVRQRRHLLGAATGTHLSSVAVPDGSGVAATGRPGRFLASSGRGGVVVIDAHSGTTTPLRSEFLDAMPANGGRSYRDLRLLTTE